ncbi:pyruvate kinase [Limnoglobus roseus]|uniref:Pyruvate kinase n=1 Tax=Limnoglobus roseus TaxID=2598579 RepID=A0A5C1AQI7_9BACT|nr:pyruvate kinase [Limnoglobus roseus]QEL20313.1 pyruvate kinase [Limnoglobus roseus]
MRRTKIVATLGPATDDPATLEAVLRAGVDVARINFSHGAADEHLARVARFRDASRRVGKVTAVLADLPGPKLRCKITAERPLPVGGELTFSLSEKAVHLDDVVITEPECLADVRPGQRVLLDDGRLQLEAEKADGGRLFARVLVGGVLKPNKGINLPDTPLSISGVTDRDRLAIEVAVKAQADWLALSFVREASAADELREAAGKFGYRGPVLAKMERPEAVARAAAIIQAFDGIMVARGDLGVEIPLEQVPMAQKQLILEARLRGKPVITATDMLDSMQKNPRPTRAEASDVSNAIFDGTDAVMLSGETAVGQFPVEAVRCMARIAEETEKHLQSSKYIRPARNLFQPVNDIIDHLTQLACDLAESVGADAILTPTLTGRTARLLARNRPWARIVGLAPGDVVPRRLSLVWGIQPIPLGWLAPGEDRMEAAVRDAYRAGVVEVGSRVVVLAGHAVEGGLGCPTVRVVKVGEDGASWEP